MEHLLVLLAFVILADVATTVYALRRFDGRLGEANPAIAWLIERIGLVPALVLSHLGLFLLLAWLKPAQWAMLVVIAGFALVAANNLRLILKRRR